MAQPHSEQIDLDHTPFYQYSPQRNQQRVEVAQ